jgi:hypothetical protein
VSDLTLARDASAHIRQDEQARRSGTNPAFLKVKNSSGSANDQWDALLSFGLPAILLEPDTNIVSATLVVYPSTYWQASASLTVGLATNSWGASTAQWSDGIGMSAERVTLPLAGPSDTNPFRVDVKSLIELVRAGRRFYGFRLQTNNTTLRSIRNNNTDMPTLYVSYTRAPARPSIAAPADGQVVDNPAPVLKMAQTDPQLSTINAIQIVTSKNAGQTWDWDSGVRLTTETMLDLATTDFPPMTQQGEERWWAGRLRGSGGDWSEWTSWARFTYETLGTVQITSPAAPPNNVVGEQAPALQWVTNGFVQQFFRALLYDNVDKRRLWDSGWLQSQEKSVHPPAGLITTVGREYRWELFATDGLNRTLVGDNEAYAGAARTFRYELAAEVAPVNGLVAEDMTPLPFVRLRFNREVLANQYEIVRDGRSRALVDLEEVLQPDGSLAWVDPSAAPRRSHTWTVRAVVNGKTSASNPTVSKTIEPAGVWLCDLANDDYITIVTDKQQTMALSEDGGTFTPLNARYGIRVTTSLHGYAGTVVGEILMTDLTGPQSGQEMRDRFMRMRERRSTEMSLILADAAYRVVPFNMTIAESPEPGRNGDYVYPCSFDFIQVGG